MWVAMRWIGLVFGLVVVGNVSGQTLSQVHQDFTHDPGWDNSNNRVVASDQPTVRQDFGWEAGKIGGHIWDSTTPAWYAVPLRKGLTFKDPFSASGTLVLPKGGEKHDGSPYIGFFNHARQEWRPWSSVAIRLWAVDHAVRPGIDYMSGMWGANGSETDLELAFDGTAHKWKLNYDPEAKPPEYDPWLRKYLSSTRQTPGQIQEKAKADEPNASLEEVQKRLTTGLAAGLLNFFHRQNKGFYTLADRGEYRGAILFQIDEGPVYHSFLMEEHRRQPVVMDRFGIFNLQMYHKEMELYLTELEVNGIAIDLKHDPQWEGHGNRVEFRETDFQRSDFGWSQTNYAGENIGEIGGTFYRLEPEDPLHGYYADEVGELSLDDPISFSGNICFTKGATDAGMFFGYFNAKAEGPDAKDGKGGPRLGITIDGPTRVGYYFSPTIKAGDAGGAKSVHGPVFLPTGQPHRFSFSYDPNANDKAGTITIALDGMDQTFKLKPGQREKGVALDRFGLLTARSGGKYVTVYLDDLTYTVRRPPGSEPARHEQKITTVPYPKGGRKY